MLRTALFTEPCCSFASPHAKTAIDRAFRSRKNYKVQSENGHMSHRVSELIERLRSARVADNSVAAYAAEDSRRFARQQ